MITDLSISNSPCLESLLVKENSLKSVHSLTIENNAILFSIVVKNGTSGSSDITENTAPFYDTTTVKRRSSHAYNNC